MVVRCLRNASAIPDAEGVFVAGNFADELAVAPLLLSHPWRFAAFVGAGVEEVLAPLGPQREGLLGPAQWVLAARSEPDEGPDAEWFVRAYQEETGSTPP
jgi:branched-chain amino acid transport system substrate-binding protein